MDRRLMVLNLRMGIALFMVSVVMLGMSFIWAAAYLQY
jgi:hypothetical protein